MQTIKAIETIYNGYRFRSRLESKWAIFFDAVDIKYRYEADSFNLDGLWYLPDFKLPLGMCGCRIWIEIKGQPPTPEEERKVLRLCVTDKHPVCILVGLPGRDSYMGFIYKLLTPDLERIQELKDVLIENEEHMHGDDRVRVVWKSAHQAMLVIGEGKTSQPIFMVDFEMGFIGEMTRFAQCPNCNSVFLDNVPDMECDCNVEPLYDSPFLRQAYIASRSARFEFGERP